MSYNINVFLVHYCLGGWKYETAGFGAQNPIKLIINKYTEDLFDVSPKNKSG